MGRGFISGLIWGSILSLMLVWMASQMSGMVEVLNAPDEVAVNAPEAVSVEPLQDNTAPLPAETTAPEPAQAPAAATPDPASDAADAAPQADTAPVAAPEATDVAQAPQPPGTGDAPAAPGTVDSPARVTASGQAPAASDQDAAPSVAETAKIPEFTQPIVVEPEAPAAPLESSDGVPAIKPDAAPSSTESAAAVPAAPMAEQAPEAGAAPESPPAAEPEPDEIAVAEPSAEPEQQPEPQPDPAAPQELEPVGTLEGDSDIANLAPEVKVNRLPTIGGETEAATSEVETALQPDAGGEATGPAIARFGAAFENPDNRPTMAILLIDEGGPRPSAEELAGFPFPVSYAVDASRTDAAEAMAAYRAAGLEVVAMTPLPDGAAPQDVEVSFETYLARMPEVVAVMDTKASAFQSSRQVARQVAEILGADGLGMITYSKGLNAATQVASREGVPAKLVFREFDNDGQNGAAIQRFLDQAAFRAGQQTGVILVGHARPETLAALLEWGLGNRAATVALAPVSAALLAQ